MRIFLRGIALFLAAVLLPVTLVMPVFADSVSAGAERRVRVGFFPFEGYYQVDSSGARSGYGYELLQLMGLHANLSYEYIDNVATWGELEQMLLDGRLDMLTSVQKTPENEAWFAFSATPISTSSTMLTVKSGNQHFVMGDYSTYAGARVGVIRNNSHAQKFEKFAKVHGFDYTPVYYDSLTDLQTALQSGIEIDACVTSNLRPLHNEWIIEQFDPSPFYMMMRKDDTELVNAVNSSLKQMDVYSPNWRTELFNKYYSLDTGSNLQLSAEERAYVQGLGDRVFRIAVNPDNAPYSYFENGEARGIIPEIFAEIARRAGIRYEIEPAGNRNDYGGLISSSATDLIMDAGWDYSTAENLGYKLTKPFLSLSVAKLTQYNANGEPNTVAIPEGTLLTELTRSSLFKEYDFITLPSTADAVKAVAAGSCDAAFLYTDAAQRWIHDDVQNKYQISLLPGIQIDMAIGARIDNDYLLISILSKSAESVRQNYAQEVVLRYTALPVKEFSFLDYLYLNPLWGIAMVSVAALVVVLLSVVILQRRNAAKEIANKKVIMEALTMARHASEAKGNFLSRMSHEIRTPLNAIIGYLTLIRCPETKPEETREYAANCVVASEQLLSIINDVMDSSAIESGHLKIANAPFDIAEVLSELMTLFQNQAKD